MMEVWRRVVRETPFKRWFGHTKMRHPDAPPRYVKMREETLGLKDLYSGFRIDGATPKKLFIWAPI